MKRFFALAAIAAAAVLTSSAGNMNDDYFLQRSQLLDYAGEQAWMLKSAATVTDAAQMAESLGIDGIDAFVNGSLVPSKASLSIYTNVETMALMVMVSTDSETLIEHIFNSAMEPVVYAYDLGSDYVSEFSLAAVAADGTKTWFSFANPRSGDSLMRFTVHRPCSLPDESPATLRLTEDQFNLVSMFLLELSEHNYINAMPYAPVQF